ncbi:MAG TPA: GTPase HflX [Cellvibrionaceae bacterium]|nr:GTPase HflX [Cellvibrionaceae bacterium]
MFFDRPESGELAVLVHIDFNRDDEPNDPREFEELALSAGADPVAFVTGVRDVPNAKFFVGTGKLAEIQAQVIEHGAQLVVFNHSLSPSQERNLERELNCRVIDRTGLILDIFAQRARTHEGKLQVELAQLHHMSTRLVRGWTHLERQGGGIGLRGPGETQLETDRRLLRGRITMLEKRLEKVRRQREQGRRSRLRADIPTVSLVGYTNAGKSTLFNSITKAGVYAENQLFATLDPTMRRVDIPGLGKVVLADTVGFISHLPHKLVEAFRATLEEAASADLLLHVIDAADPERARNIEQVEKVLGDIQALDIPRLNLYNKIDLLRDMEPRIDQDDSGSAVAVWLSAQAGSGLELLSAAIAQKLGHQICRGAVRLKASQGSLRAKLHSAQAVQNEVYNEDGSIQISLCLPQMDLNRILAAELLTPDQLEWLNTQP